MQTRLSPVDHEVEPVVVAGGGKRSMIVVLIWSVLLVALVLVTANLAANAETALGTWVFISVGILNFVAGGLSVFGLTMDDPQLIFRVRSKTDSTAAIRSVHSWVYTRVYAENDVLLVVRESPGDVRERSIETARWGLVARTPKGGFRTIMRLKGRKLHWVNEAWLATLPFVSLSEVYGNKW